MQITQPSRVEVAAYREMRVEVERLAHELHVRWPRRDGSSPIEAIIKSQDRRRVAALLASADVCLVTPHRDGMNLVAKEFSTLNELRGGAPVISKGAGAAIELGAHSVTIDEASPLAIAGGLRDAARAWHRASGDGWPRPGPPSSAGGRRPTGPIPSSTGSAVPPPPAATATATSVPTPNSRRPADRNLLISARPTA